MNHGNLINGSALSIIFSFNVSTEKKTIKALCSAVLTATGTAIGAGISSYASDCIEETLQ